ncbi:hypothetical protein HAX54_051411, partial [Datura stramonium]|nr:hypothetical protein [Datura stramonium]
HWHTLTPIGRESWQYSPTFELVAPGLPDELYGTLLGEFPTASDLIASYNSQLV